MIDPKELKKSVDHLVKNLPEPQKKFFYSQLNKIKQAVKDKDENKILEIAKKAREQDLNA